MTSTFEMVCTILLEDFTMRRTIQTTISQLQIFAYSSVFKAFENKFQDLSNLVKIVVVESFLTNFIVHLVTKSKYTLGVSVCEVTCMFIAEEFNNLVEAHFL